MKRALEVALVVLSSPVMGLLFYLYLVYFSAYFIVSQLHPLPGWSPEMESGCYKTNAMLTYVECKNISNATFTRFFYNFIYGFYYYPLLSMSVLDYAGNWLASLISLAITGLLYSPLAYPFALGLRAHRRRKNTFPGCVPLGTRTEKRGLDSWREF